MAETKQQSSRARRPPPDQPEEPAGEARATPTASATLGQRISWVTKEIGRVKQTGRNRFGSAALSVEDVEDALGGLLADAGIVTSWRTLLDPPILITPQGKEEIWRMWFGITVMRDDDTKTAAWLAHLDALERFKTAGLIGGAVSSVGVPTPPDTDAIHAVWMDVGTSPAATQSFAVKGYYRRLFHIASGEDEHVRAPRADPPAYDPEQPHTFPRPQVVAQVPDSARDALYALGDQLGHSREKIDGLLKEYSVASIMARMERDLAMQEAATRTGAEVQQAEIVEPEPPIEAVVSRTEPEPTDDSNAGGYDPNGGE